MCVLICKEVFRLYREAIYHLDVWQFNCVDTGILCCVHKTCQPPLLKYGPWATPCFYLERVKMQFPGRMTEEPCGAPSRSKFSSGSQHRILSEGTEAQKDLSNGKKEAALT